MLQRFKMHQYSLFDIYNIPNPEIKPPKYNKELLKGIKGLSDIVDKVPKYLVTFKKPVYGGYIKKVCIYVGYFHSLDGWNYNNDKIKEYKEINYKKGMKYRYTE